MTTRFKPGISVVTSAYNEELSLRGGLESVAAWADEIVVVNGSSTDGTAHIAREFTANVITTTNKLMLNVNKNIAIDAATHEWVLVIDPDERVTPDLAAELQQIAANGGDAAAYWMPRKNHELGRWIKHMGLYPDLQLRFFRNGAARFPCLHIHEMVQVQGETGQLRGALDHWPKQSLAEYVHKRNLYSEHRATYLYEHGKPFRMINLIVRPLKAFAKQYIARGGWKEGVPGFIIGVSGAYSTFLQDAKLWQKWEEREEISHTGEIAIAAPKPKNEERAVA